MKPVIAILIVCALATACTVRSNTVVEKPVPATTTTVAVPASSAPASSTVVVRN